MREGEKDKKDMREGERNKRGKDRRKDGRWER